MLLSNSTFTKKEEPLDEAEAEYTTDELALLELLTDRLTDDRGLLRIEVAKATNRKRLACSGALVGFSATDLTAISEYKESVSAIRLTFSPSIARRGEVKAGGKRKAEIDVSWLVPGRARPKQTSAAQDANPFDALVHAANRLVKRWEALLAVPGHVKGPNQVRRVVKAMVMARNKWLILALHAASYAWENDLKIVIECREEK